MFDEAELKKQIVDGALSRVAEAMTGNYEAASILRSAHDKLAAKVADVWIERHMADVLHAVDLDTVIKLATLKMIEKIVSKLG